MHSENCAMSDLLIETLRRIETTFLNPNNYENFKSKTGKLDLDFSPF